LELEATPSLIGLVDFSYLKVGWSFFRLSLSTIAPNSTEIMALDPQGYVVSLQNNIRSRPIPWEGAVRAKTLSEEAYKYIKAIDKVRKELRCQALGHDTEGYVSLFLGGKSGTSIFPQVAKRQEILLYLLVLFDDAIQGTIILQLPSNYMLTSNQMTTISQLPYSSIQTRMRLSYRSLNNSTTPTTLLPC
jgi:hypothetical protein